MAALYPHKGKFSLLDRQVDATTGTLKLGPVPQPGEPACARASSPWSGRPRGEKGALLVPQRAVTEMQGKYLVAVVGADNTVEIRTVTPGERIGSQWVIDEGLKPGEKIVVEGIQKVKAGRGRIPKPFDPDGEAGERPHRRRPSPRARGKPPCPSSSSTARSWRW